MFSFESLELPVVAAPMAGGPTTTELVIDASKAGGWGVLAGGNKDVDTMAREVRDVQDAGVAAGVNLFIPGPQSTDAEALAGLREKLGPIAKKFDVELGEPSWDDDDYGAKLDWLVTHPVDVVTFTFGLPSAEDVTALRGVGTSLGAMVTAPEDARAAVERGMDFLIVQGPDAGGHQSTFDLYAEPSDVALPQLFDDVRGAVDVPLLAAGGIATPADTQAALDAGAVAVQAGTAYLRSSSAGSSLTHRLALASDDFSETGLTRAFSGRYARGLANEFMAMFDGITAVTPAAYPEVNRLLAPLRKKAAETGDPQWTHLWAGKGWRRSAAAMPGRVIEGDAGRITRWLAGRES